MNKETTRILNNLIEGIDPVSGKKLPADLFKIIKQKSVLQALKDALTINEEKTKPTTNHGARWTDIESVNLDQLWKSHPDIFAISVIMGRTPTAIAAKLVDLGVYERRDQVPGYEDHRKAIKSLKEEAH